jgi:dTDP-glucose pyrophosphorylase
MHSADTANLFKKTLITKDAKVIDALKSIDSSGLQVALVIDDIGRLLGVITDGDFRRGFLRGVKMDDPAMEIMNPNPLSATLDTPEHKILELMKLRFLSQIPIVDRDGIVVDIKTLTSLITQHKKDNFVILMAGGLGKRLSPLTDNSPKPLLKVGNKPILQIIIENFIDHGFVNFFISVNYKADMIKEFFKDGKSYGINIQYIEENEPLGTAGALSLLKEKPEKPIIVMNGDLLTKLNISNLLDFHLQQKADATMGVREYDFQVPYGVVKIDNDVICAIDEKPMQKFFVNAGVYVLNPEVLTQIPEHKYFDMPSLFNETRAKGKKTIAFPIREYWMDIGRRDDFDKANFDFLTVFGDK